MPALHERVILDKASACWDIAIQGEKTMPTTPRILIGGEFFRELRENDCYYADKTALIEELLFSVPPKVSLLTRPRRFGKTLTMTMLREFFDIQKDDAILDIR